MSHQDRGLRNQRDYQVKCRAWGVVGNFSGARWGLAAAPRRGRGSITSQNGIDGCADVSRGCANCDAASHAQRGLKEMQNGAAGGYPARGESALVVEAAAEPILHAAGEGPATLVAALAQ
ncbi:hypothetical protein MTIM_14310 [Mycobacterium timonense]|uniref:Uncharacterized protein n=1 Tax=Mycobacterium timonense TaxID=701043 RepID=A0A7I9Z3X3_9MYCO|nr:hypothetical protein MTIM_14310 [Mycobacterium timonense]